MLTLKHFDCRLNQWIEHPSNEGELFTETLENTLLEQFFPDGGDKFSIGRIDQYNKVEDLKNHPNGDILLLASGARLVYGPPDYLTRIEAICPDPKDRGAYGSLFVGNCPENIQGKFNILVVDDEGIPRLDEKGQPTGEWEVEPGGNGGILPTEEAFKLVGDCHGKIAPNLAAHLAEGRIDKVIQHRVQFGADRFGKGTVAPWDLENLPYADPNQTPPIDLVLPVSSFKGGDKTHNPIQPGLYENIPLWMGRKDLSPEPTSQVAISQTLASAPQGLKDFIEESEWQALELLDAQKDPRLIAEKYVKRYEQRQANLEGGNENAEESEPAETPEERWMYRVIKTDLESGHPQLLETQKVQNELQRFVRSQWRDIAVGRSLKFDRKLIVPSKNLAEGEICDPCFPEGERLLNFRSPYLNSNGMCVSLNKHVPEAYAPDGSPLEGVLAVSDETLARIAARQRREGQPIHLPRETESQRQGRDFDGDTIGIAPASQYPNLTREAIRRNLPENAYAPTVKEKKMSFSNPDGTGWEFERIALFMADGMAVGKINNVVTAAAALESEAEILRENGTPEQKLDYLHDINDRYLKLQRLDRNPENPFKLPENYRGPIEEFCQQYAAIGKNRTNAPSHLSRSGREEVALDTLINLNRSIYRQLIEEGCYQNQIAVDMFKSARQPDVEKIDRSRQILYRTPAYIRDKKRDDIYTSRNNQAHLIATEGYSPVELLVEQTNEIFEQAHLEARPTIQFRNLFEANYTPQQIALVERQKAEFDRAFNQATARARALDNEQGPNLHLKCFGIELEISNVVQTLHPALNSIPLEIDSIRLANNSGKRQPHQLIALAQTAPGSHDWKPLGTVSESSRVELNLEAGREYKVESSDLKAGLNPKAVDQLFFEAFNRLDHWVDSIPKEERAQYAAAAWHVGTNRESEANTGTDYKVSNFSFYAFKAEILDRVANHPTTQFDLAGLNLEAIARLTGKPAEVQFVAAPETGKVQLQTSEGTPLAYISQTGAQLPIGSTGVGTITPNPAATATLTHPQLREGIKINKLSQGDFAETALPATGDMTVRLERSRYPALSLNGKSLGKLDRKSVETLGEAGKLDGTPFAATIRSEGTGRGQKAAIETDGGLLLKTDQNFSAYRHKTFNGEKVQLNFQAIEETKTIRVAYLGERKIGEIADRAARDTLTAAGINQDGQILKGARLTPNTTTARLELQPESIQYPEKGQWVGASAPNRVVRAKQSSRLDIRKRVAQLKSLAFEAKGWTTLVCDRKTVENAIQWFQQQGIEVGIPCPENFPAEIARGYQPIMMKTEDIVAAKVRDAIAQQVGTIYPNNDLGGEYRQTLLKRPTKEHLDRLYPPPLERDIRFPGNNDCALAHRSLRTEEGPRPPKNHNPLADLQPLNARVAQHARKDIAMAEIATQFIGYSAAPPRVPSSTRNYEAAWGDRANTGCYTASDIVMVSGSGPWRGVAPAQIQTTFESHYPPLLDRAIAARATLVVGNAQGTDQLVQAYLKDRNYQISDSGRGYAIGRPQLERTSEPRPTDHCSLVTGRCRPLPPSQTPQTFVESSSGLPPLTAEFDSDRLAVQHRRTAEIAPTIAALLNAQNTPDYTGQNYRATWNDRTRELQLFDREGNLKMVAVASRRDWEPQPLPENNSLALNDGDLTHFRNLAQQVKKHLVQRTLNKNSQSER